MTELSVRCAGDAPESSERVALVTASASFTYRELGARVVRVQTSLASRGVVTGARVALRARNDEATVFAVHALLELGAAIVPIHPRLTDAEAAVILEDAAPQLTLTGDDVAQLGEVTTEAARPSAHPASLPLAIVYTSGTTGRPKGAVLSRRAFLASATASAANLGWTDDDRWLLCMPLCHVGGLSIVTRCLAARRTVVLVPRFDVDAVLEAIVRHRATLLSVVPTMLRALLEADTENHLARIRAILVGGAATPFELLQECELRGVTALTTYGLTEACSQVTVQPLASPYRARRGSGRALGSVELRVSEAGDILVRGPALMDGYFNTSSVAPAPKDVWFRTGDVGEIDGEGVLHVHARRTDLVVTGGENVYPVEVEHQLATVAGIRDALVFGVRDDRWGQIVAAALVLAEGATLDSVAPDIALALASHKRPRLACVVPALPLTASGKPTRAGAAARYAAELRPLGVRRG